VIVAQHKLIPGDNVGAGINQRDDDHLVALHMVTTYAHHADVAAAGVQDLAAQEHVRRVPGELGVLTRCGDEELGEPEETKHGQQRTLQVLGRQVVRSLHQTPVRDPKWNVDMLA